MTAVIKNTEKYNPHATISGFIENASLDFLYFKVITDIVISKNYLVAISGNAVIPVLFNSELNNAINSILNGNYCLENPNIPREKKYQILKAMLEYIPDHI